MAAPTTGLTVIKRFSYRGDATEEWSNSYLLTGSTPASSAAWRTLFDALVTQEKTLYPGWHSVVAGYGYDSADDDRVAVWSVDLTVSPNTPVAGTFSSADGVAPGDCAMWVRWGLDRMNTKGKRVYLRKYFHGVQHQAGGDLVSSAQKTAAVAFGEKLRDGSFASGRLITDALGTALVGTGASTFVTTRTLKRRSKRATA